MIQIFTQKKNKKGTTHICTLFNKMKGERKGEREKKKKERERKIVFLRSICLFLGWKRRDNPFLFNIGRKEKWLNPCK